MPEVVDWLADDGLDPAVFASGNHTAMWREIARFEAVLLARLQDWATRNALADQRRAGVLEADEPVSGGDRLDHGRRRGERTAGGSIPGQAARSA